MENIIKKISTLNNPDKNEILSRTKTLRNNIRSATLKDNQFNKINHHNTTNLLNKKISASNVKFEFNNKYEEDTSFNYQNKTNQSMFSSNLKVKKIDKNKTTFKFGNNYLKERKKSMEGKKSLEHAESQNIVEEFAKRRHTILAQHSIRRSSLLLNNPDSAFNDGRLFKGSNKTIVIENMLKNALSNKSEDFDEFITGGKSISLNKVRKLPRNNDYSKNNSDISNTNINLFDNQQSMQSNKKSSRVDPDTLINNEDNNKDVGYTSPTTINEFVTKIDENQISQTNIIKLVKESKINCLIKKSSSNKEEHTSTPKTKYSSKINIQKTNSPNYVRKSYDRRKTSIYDRIAVAKIKDLSNSSNDPERRQSAIDRKIEKKRNIQKFLNIYDSISENDDNNEEFIKKSYSIDPSNEIYLHWTNFYSFYLVCLIFYYGLVFAFDKYRNSTIISILICEVLLSDIIIILNIIITLFVGIHKNNLISYSISYAYSINQYQIVIQIIASLPFSILKVILVMYHNNKIYNIVETCGFLIKFFPVLLFLKWINLSYIFEDSNNMLEYAIKYVKKNKMIYFIITIVQKIKGFMGVLVFFFMISHICCSIMINLALKNSTITNSNWLNHSNLTESSYLDIYFASFYFIMSTFLTVGYGDIISTNTEERIFSITMLLVGCFFYSYILTTFSSLFKIQNKYLQIFYEKKEILSDIKKKFRLNENLFKIINRNLYLNYKKGGVEKNDFLISLPSVIKNELIFKMYSKRILKLDFFKEILKNKELIVNIKEGYNISKNTLISMNTFNSTMNENRHDIKRVVHTEEFITVVVPMLHRYVYHKGEQVWAFNQLVDEMFMIENGKVNFCLGYEYQNYSIGYLKKNKHYGEVVMFSDEQTSPFDIIVTSKISEIFTLGQKEFHHLRETFTWVVEKLLAKSVKNHLGVETLRTVAIEYYSINLTFEGLRSLINTLVKDDISNYLSVIEADEDQKKIRLMLLKLLMIVMLTKIAQGTVQVHHLHQKFKSILFQLHLIMIL